MNSNEDLIATRSEIVRRSINRIRTATLVLVEVTGPDDCFTLRITKKAALGAICEANGQLEARPGPPTAPVTVILGGYIGYYKDE